MTRKTQNTTKRARRWTGRVLRLGSYGDPTAAPFEAWEQLLATVAGWTGYTHQWAYCDSRWAGYLMASTHTAQGNDRAHGRGYSTFRTVGSALEILADERPCLAQTRGLTCDKCKACRGCSAANRAVVAHGSPPVLAKYRRAVAALQEAESDAA